MMTVVDRMDRQVAGSKEATIERGRGTFFLWRTLVGSMEVGEVSVVVMHFK